MKTIFNSTLTVEIPSATTTSENLWSLVLLNDDHNSMETVVTALITVLQHSLEQATQCMLIAHYKGECEVKRGKELSELLVYQEKLLYDFNISSRLEVS